MSIKTRILIPIKRLEESKSTFSGVLNGEQRQELAISMLKDLMDACSGIDNAELTVVSPDGEVLELVEKEGYNSISEPDIGLNRALELAIDSSIGSGFDEVLILPGDLPLARRDDIREILNLASGDRSVVITPSKEGGTNALLLRPPDVMSLHFGGESFKDHFEEAQSRGIRPEIYRSERIERDIDKPRDLIKLETQAKGTETHAFLNLLKS